MSKPVSKANIEGVSVCILKGQNSCRIVRRSNHVLQPEQCHLRERSTMVDSHSGASFSPNQIVRREVLVRGKHSVSGDAQ